MLCHYTITDAMVVGERFRRIFPHTLWFYLMLHRRLLLPIHSWVPVTRGPPGIILVAKSTRHHSDPILINDTSELSPFGDNEVLGVSPDVQERRGQFHWAQAQGSS